MIPVLTLIAALALPQGVAAPPDTLAAAALLGPTASSVTLTTPGPTIPRADDPQLIEYSDAYFTRLTIHKWASYLTVPLFVGEYVVGQKLMDGQSDLKGVHGALAGTIAGLFAVNTITGGLNAIQARKDPEGRNRRTLHSVLMLLADAGFAATGMLANENENENDGGFHASSSGGNNNAHRNMAIASMSTALVSYAIMLPFFGRD
jgi:hypothetical protein